MESLRHPATSYTPTPTTNWLALYANFVNKAEFNRFGWAATSLMIQGCLLTPALLLSIFQFGGGDWQVLIAFLSFLLVLVPVLSALPVKYLFPTFAFSAFLHIVLILTNVL